MNILTSERSSSTPSSFEFFLKYEILRRVIDWLEIHKYRLPLPSSDNVSEIRVAAELDPKSFVVDVLIFDSKTKKLKAIELDIYKLRNPVIHRIDL